MSATMSRQTYEALGYDKHMSAMVFNVEKKRVAQNMREVPRDDYTMIDSRPTGAGNNNWMFRCGSTLQLEHWVHTGS